MGFNNPRKVTVQTSERISGKDSTPAQNRNDGPCLCAKPFRFAGLSPFLEAYYAKSRPKERPSGHCMFEPKPPFPRPERRFLSAPQLQRFVEPKQRRMMVAALTLLLIALGFVLYRDRDFWFPDTEEAQEDAQPDQPQPAAPSKGTSPSRTVTVARATPALGKNSFSKNSYSSKATPKTLPSAVPADPPAIDRSPVDHAPISDADLDHSAGARPSADPSAIDHSTPDSPDDAPPGMTMSNRTVLPALEVEVVAGDAHRTVQPGNNSVHVDLQSSPSPAVEASTTAPTTSPDSSSNVSAAEAPSAMTNAAERVQMSADTAEVVSRPVNPGYPTLARQMKVQGSVILRAFIGRDGLIQDLRLVSGPPILASAAEEAVRQWHFKPHYIGAEAVETQARITVNFTISTN